MGTHVHLPRVSRHIGLICMADQWAWPPLAVRVASVACGSEPPATLGTTHMILGVVHKRLSIRLFDSINSEVPDINSLIRPYHNLLRARAAVPYLSFAFPTALAFLPENGPR
jgi:hypothetical protein